MKNDFLNDLRIASPCPVAWQDMTGTDQVRLCSQCDLHVYDISQLTRDETATLINTSEGRICARLHRRADGTVITRDCPVGLRALRKRVARRAGAILTAILSLSGSVFSQTRTPDKESCNIKVIKLVEQQQTPDQKPMITGIVKDTNGLGLPGAMVTLTSATTKEQFTTTTTDAGEFRFADLQTGEYTLHIARLSFQFLTVPQLPLKAGEALRFELTLEPSAAITVLSGIIDLPLTPEPPIYSNGTLRLSGDLLRRLPH